MDQHQRRSFNNGVAGGGVPLFDKNFDRTAYDSGRLVRALGTPRSNPSLPNNSRSRAVSASGPEISLGKALLLLAGFLMTLLVIAAVIGYLNSSQQPDNFTRDQEPRPEAVVHPVQRIPSPTVNSAR